MSEELDTVVEELDYDVVEFATKRTAKDREKSRRAGKVKVDLVGVEYELLRPKDFRLFAFSGATSANASEADTFYQIIRLVDEIFDPIDRKSFYNRACDRDDPLTQEAVFALLEELSDRWGATTDAAASRPVTIKAYPSLTPGLKPVHIKAPDLGEEGLDMVFHPPKDILLGMVASVLSASADDQAMAWAVGLFLDGALDMGQRRLLERRLHTRYGDLDLEDLLDLVNTLMERWHPEDKGPNRQARRARASTQRKKTATKAVKAKTKINPPKG